jgi:hypothetical protein
MIIDDIRKRLTGGVIPFTIRIFEGEKFRVPHKEFVFVTARRAVVADKRGWVNVLDPRHMVSIQEAKSLPTR